MIPFPYVLMRRMMASVGGSKDMASLAPASGITYTSGLTGLTAAEVSAMSALISNEPTITKDAITVYVDMGDLHRKLDIANQVTLSLNGANYAFDILGFNHDALTNTTAYGKATSTGNAGITLQMHSAFSTQYKMNNTAITTGGWRDSVMRTSTMAAMKSYLPSTWQEVIKLVDKISGVGGGASSGTEIVSDACFLLSEIEVFGTTTYSVDGEGSQYAYYKAGNSTQKKRGSYTSRWLERSPRKTYGKYFCMVETTGAASSSDANIARDVAFAFCV